MNDALWSFGGIVLGLVASVGVVHRLLTMRTYHCIMAIATFLLCSATIVEHHWLATPFNAVNFGFQLFGWWIHRNDDDESKRGRRLKRWARNTLQRFATILLRPIQRTGEVRG